MDPTTIEIVRATDQTIAVTFSDASGNPINITGYKIYFTVKTADDIDESDSSDAEAAIQVSGTVSDGPNGKANIVLTNAQTAIASGNYYYDLKLISGDETPIVSATTKAQFNIIDPVTNKNS